MTTSKRTNRIAGIAGILFVLAIIILYVGIGIPKIAQPEVEIGLRVDEVYPNEVDSDNVDLIVKLLSGDNQLSELEFLESEYQRSFHVPMVSISLDYLFASPDLIVDGSVCVEEIVITSLDLELPDQKLVENPGICFDKNDGNRKYVLGYSKKLVNLVYNPYDGEYHSSNRYPFDKRSLHFRMKTNLVIINQDDVRIPLKVDPRIVVNAPPPERGKEVWKLYEGTDSTGAFYNLEVSRPVKYKTITIIILVTIFLTIANLLVALLRETGSFWEVAVGILLGLWGIQDVLIPSYVESPTLIVDIISFLYIFLSFVILVRIFGLAPKIKNILNWFWGTNETARAVEDQDVNI